MTRDPAKDPERRVDLRALDGLEPPRVVEPYRPSSRTWLGLLVFAGLAACLVLPIERLRHLRPSKLPLDTRPPALPAPSSDEVDATGVAAALASAAGVLAEIESLRKRPDERASAGAPAPTQHGSGFPEVPADLPEPPAASDYDSPTACMESYLVDVELPEGSLDFVCQQTEMWTIEHAAYPIIAGMTGRGATTWRQLGHYALAAMTTLRAGCCDGSLPLEATDVTSRCGKLGDKLKRLGSVPERAAFEAYEKTIRCIEERQVHLPTRWVDVDEGTERGALYAFVTHAWRRGASTR